MSIRKILSKVFLAVAILQGNAMCAVVAYFYRDMECGRAHMGYTSPVSVAFVYALPFLLEIAFFLFLSYVMNVKDREEKLIAKVNEQKKDEMPKAEEIFAAAETEAKEQESEKGPEQDAEN